MFHFAMEDVEVEIHSRMPSMWHDDDAEKSKFA
jgi:hypothetical protein